MKVRYSTSSSYLRLPALQERTLTLELFLSSLADDHPSTSAPDVETASLSLDEILEEIEASDGGLVLVDENGRRMVGDGVVEMLAGAMGAR